MRRFAESTNSAGGTSSLPSATDDNKFFVFDVNLQGRKRYLDLSATCGDGSAGTFACAWAELYRGEKVPATATIHVCALGYYELWVNGRKVGDEVLVLLRSIARHRPERYQDGGELLGALLSLEA